MSYRIEFSPQAKREFTKLSRSIQIQLQKKIDSLAEDPRPPGVKKLSGEYNLYRVRAGDYRIIYAIDDNKLLILIARAGNRREIYR